MFRPLEIHKYPEVQSYEMVEGDPEDWHARYWGDSLTSHWRIATVEQILVDAGFDRMQQPQRQRLANWLRAEDGESVTVTPDERYLTPLEPFMYEKIVRLEEKRERNREVFRHA